MASPLRAVLFDVNGTLSDLSPLRARLAEVGASGDLLPAWFAGVLRDGFALAASALPAVTSDACASASIDASRYMRPTESITVASLACHCSAVLPISRIRPS